MTHPPTNPSQPTTSLESRTNATGDASFALEARTPPRSVLFVAVILVAFVGLLCLEVSDSFFRHDGQIARSLFVLPVVVLLLWGLVSRRRWAWLITRVVALLAAALYVATIAVVWIAFAQMQTGARIGISVVSAILGGLVLLAYLALGSGPARAYFRI